MAFGRLDVESTVRHKPEEKGLLAETWSTGAWRLAPIIFTFMFSVAVLLPAKPDIITDFFASQEAKRPITCSSYPMGRQPEVCRNAHSDAVWWGSFSDFVSHSIVTFLLAPLVGRWSDRLGRRPFIALFLAVASIPPLLLTAHITAGVSLYYYFPAQVFFVSSLVAYSATLSELLTEHSCLSSDREAAIAMRAFSGTNMLISLCTAYVSDLMSSHHRSSAIGLIMASFAVAFLVGPPVGGILGLKPASIIAMAGAFVALALLLLIVPESLSQAAKDTARAKQRSEGQWAQLPWSTMRILTRSQLFIKLTACMCIIGFVALGLLEMLAQYLQLKLSYTKMDLAVVITIAGAVGLITQTVILRLMMRFFGETKTLIFGSISRVLEQLILCAAFNRATVVLAIVVGALAHLSMPAISGLVSKNSEPHEQGTAQGALYGALALSQGFGPLAFAYLFSGFTRSDSDWIYFPGAPYLFGALLMAVSVVLACTISATEADKGLQPGSFDDSTRYNSEKEGDGFALRPAADLASTGGPSLIQRQPSTYLPLASQKSSSSSLETAPSRRLSSDVVLRSAGSVDGRLQLR